MEVFVFEKDHLENKVCLNKKQFMRSYRFESFILECVFKKMIHEETCIEIWERLTGVEQLTLLFAKKF